LHRTAVWNAGFEAAAARAKDIAGWLDDGAKGRLRATQDAA
jgi:hypothetical protein